MQDRIHLRSEAECNEIGGGRKKTPTGSILMDDTGIGPITVGTGTLSSCRMMGSLVD